MQTYMAKPTEINHRWYVLDAKRKTLGHLAVEAAKLLRGKDKALFTPHLDCGDYVIVINAQYVHLTGNKLDTKLYRSHSGYTGGLRERTARIMRDRYPIEMIECAVRGMLPKNKLGRALFKKLYVYSGDQHAHEGQKPERYEFGNKEE